MSVARFAAHPLVVAVALGLLAPPILADGDDTPARDDGSELPAAAPEVAAPAIDPAELARVEREWLAVRDLEGAQGLSLSVGEGVASVR